MIENFIQGNVAPYQQRIVEIEKQLAEAQAANERDRSQVALVLARLHHEFRGTFWLRSESPGRGSYSWDDERWKSEFTGACERLRKAVEPLRDIARDWSHCPNTQAEVDAARASLFQGSTP